MEGLSLEAMYELAPELEEKVVRKNEKTVLFGRIVEKEMSEEELKAVSLGEILGIAQDIDVIIENYFNDVPNEDIFKCLYRTHSVKGKRRLF